MQEETAVAAEHLRIGGLTPFTTIDFPGKLSAVVFVKGCPWKCLYCQNPDLRHRDFAAGEDAVSWEAVRAFLKKRHGLIDAVVFSGGEPCSDHAVVEAAREARELGYDVGLHTAGMYPERVEKLLPYLSWVGLDVKAPLNDPELYDRIIRRKAGSEKTAETLKMLLAAGISLEVRTTAHPSYLSPRAIIALGEDLKGRGVRKFVLQIYRRPPNEDPEFLLENVPSDYPGEDAEQRLKEMFPQFEIRRSR